MNIVICNFKGGVGKSLIAHQLITTFNFSGIEIDPYGSLAQRLPNKVKNIDISKKDIEPVNNTIFDFGGFNDIKLKAAIDQSDLIIIPFNATIEVLQSTIDTINEVKKFNKPILFIANMLQKEEDLKEIKQIINDLLGFENEFFEMPLSVSFQTAINENVSVLTIANQGGLKAFSYKKAKNIILGLKEKIEIISETPLEFSKDL